MKLDLLVSLCLVCSVALALDVDHVRNNRRESRKLFGGYRITPRYCQPSKKPEQTLGGPSICMFNHECRRREGQVVGACMDGFLFGACCELPKNVMVGEFLDDDIVSVGVVENKLSTHRPSFFTMRPQTTPIDITSIGVSQITNSLLNPGSLPTAQDNEIIQVDSDEYFTTTGVTHPNAPDTVLLNAQDNDIDPGYFKPTHNPLMDDRRTTVRTEDPHSPMLSISISNAPLEYTTIPGFTRPMFRPKPNPTDDNFVRVPTLTHDTTKPNNTKDYDSIVNIIQILNSSSTNIPYRPSITSTSRRPDTIHNSKTSPKPPSTSYIYSTTLPPRRTEATTTKKKPTKKTKPPTKATKKPTTTYFYSGPTKTTSAYSPTAFYTSERPQSTSYIYNSGPTRRPPSTVNGHIAGPGFSVTSSPLSSTYPTPAPTIIILGPIEDSTRPSEPKPTTYKQKPTTYNQHPSTLQRPTAIPQRKPVNHVTINNHVTQNIYSTTERPSPTILITPKPSISSSLRPDDDTVEVGASGPASDDLINFPPVRNPNLNMSHLPSMGESDITTPIFVEDDALNANVESFVNKIIQGLQEPFQDLRDVVFDRKNVTVLNVETTSKKPTPTKQKQGTTTKTPQVVSTRPSRPPTTTVIRPTTISPTTRRPSTRRPTTTKKPVTTTKKTKATKKPITTTQSFIEHSTELTSVDNEDYRTECGVRPLMRSAKIVGGKGATFGEFPWQVLVRESTWLGLFTKNKCGGVLISHKYVMTAAHCQPGFLASLVAVFGEFDISGDLEKKRPISRNVKRVIVHRQYDAQTFENDLALLELEQPVQFDTHIIPICLPRDGEDFTGRMATVTGWGRLKYGGGVPSVLQEVQVPIMENHVCQEMFRTAGHSKVILESFLCAGYANGQKDSCEGDSGGPLVLQRPDGRYQLAGTVSHGIKCAAPYLPGVYMRTQYFKPWITSITAVTAP
ncbi:hypothetical protein JTB14_023740 [Gonioctena quinquepunctata]|nr:hypothetical protein JTB14_023740 [Gonioctena quinquepunctata]